MDQPRSLFDKQIADDRLLQITLDQLRTLIIVAETRSPRRAAQQLGRDQSSIEKQLRTLSAHFSELADEELLIRPTQRGGEIDLTHAGEAVIELARSSLEALNESCMKLRQMQQDRPLRLALTTFLLPLLLNIQPEVAQRFAEHGWKLSRELIHVRSSEVQEILLRCKDVDFSMGGFTTTGDDPKDILEELDFLEWKRDRLVLLTNLHDHSANRISFGDLRKDRWPLILPRGGVISTFVQQVWGGPDGLNVVEWCNEVHFALELLALGVHKAAMIATAQIAEQAINSQTTKPLRVIELDGCDFHLRVGLFRRKNDATTYLARHPMSIFWNTCVELAAEKRRAALNQSKVGPVHQTKPRVAKRSS